MIIHELPRNSLRKRISYCLFLINGNEELLYSFRYLIISLPKSSILRHFFDRRMHPPSQLYVRHVLVTRTDRRIVTVAEQPLTRVGAEAACPLNSVHVHQVPELRADEGTPGAWRRRGLIALRASKACKEDLEEGGGGGGNCGASKG